MAKELLHILLVEDNVSFAVELEMHLTEMGHHVVATVDQADAALSYLKGERPDMAIIDIGLKGPVDGLEVARQFTKASTPVIFSTARKDSDTFEKANAFAPLAYLVKPFDKLTLQSCLNQAIRLQQAVDDQITKGDELVEEESFHHDFFFIRNKGALHKIKFEDIYYVQSDRNYSILFVKNRKYAAKISLNNLIKKLPIDKFVRIHQSYIIQFELIDRINVNEDTISINGTSLPLGKTYKSALMKQIKRI